MLKTSEKIGLAAVAVLAVSAFIIVNVGGPSKEVVITATEAQIERIDTATITPGTNTAPATGDSTIALPSLDATAPAATDPAIAEVSAMSTPDTAATTTAGTPAAAGE